jgi:hypothetical protein
MPRVTCWAWPVHGNHTLEPHLAVNPSLNQCPLRVSISRPGTYGVQTGGANLLRATPEHAFLLFLLHSAACNLLQAPLQANSAP